MLSAGVVGSRFALRKAHSKALGLASPGAAWYPAEAELLGSILPSSCSNAWGTERGRADSSDPCSSGALEHSQEGKMPIPACPSTEWGESRPGWRRNRASRPKPLVISLSPKGWGALFICLTFACNSLGTGRRRRSPDASLPCCGERKAGWKERE